jgi:hypothetical protein
MHWMIKPLVKAGMDISRRKRMDRRRLVVEEKAGGGITS